MGGQSCSKYNNYAQLETPRLRQSQQQPQPQQYRSSMYNPNHHYYYLNASEQQSGKKRSLDHNASRSIDVLYAPAAVGESVGSGKMFSI